MRGAGGSRVPGLSRRGPRRFRKSSYDSGVQGGPKAGPEPQGKKTVTRKKPEKFRSCMARLLRSNIQDFVQKVAVGQMAQGTPFRSPAVAHFRKKTLNLPTVSNTSPKTRRITTFEEASLGNQAKRDYDFTAATVKSAGDDLSSTKVVLPENENPVCRRTAVPVLKLYYLRTRIQPAAGDGRSSTKVVLPENEKIQPAAGDGRSSTRVVLPERASSRPSATAVPVLITMVQPGNENPAGRR